MTMLVDFSIPELVSRSALDSIHIEMQPELFKEETRYTPLSDAEGAGFGLVFDFKLPQ